MHWILFLLFYALFAVYFGHAKVKHESSPVSQMLLCDITTLAPLRCMIMQLSKYLKGFCCATNLSMMTSLISLIHLGTSCSL
jgi:hypothetical protein